jgi:RNA 2',3'-cyclic 3'-phosphodiesterase
MRTFIAIKLPAKIKDPLTEIQDQLKITLPKLNWVKSDNLHLSLKFIGEITDEQVTQAEQIIDQLTKAKEPFEIKLDLLGVFPDWRRARIIWIGTHQASLQLNQLVQEAEKECLKLKIPTEKHLFQTHITLGRIRNLIDQSKLKETLQASQNQIHDMDLKFTVEGIALFQSVLSSDGPNYRILKEAKL